MSARDCALYTDADVLQLALAIDSIPVELQRAQLLTNTIAFVEGKGCKPEIKRNVLKVLREKVRVRFWEILKSTSRRLPTTQAASLSPTAHCQPSNLAAAHAMERFRFECEKIGRLFHFRQMTGAGCPPKKGEAGLPY
jgi:hypothetical protein